VGRLGPILETVDSLKNQSLMTSVYLQTEVAPMAQTLQVPFRVVPSAHL